MEIDPLYADWLTVVDDFEFDLLSKLTDDWERIDESSLRRVEGSKGYVVMREVEWLRCQEICKQVVMECDALDAGIVADQAQAEMHRLLAIEKPKGLDVETPIQPENGNQHPNWPAKPFVSSFIKF